MLVAQARWLPQYKRAIPAAKARFAAEEKLGTHGSEGAARVKTKTVADMKQDAGEARRNAEAADKAMAQRKKRATQAG